MSMLDTSKGRDACSIRKDDALIGKRNIASRGLQHDVEVNCVGVNEEPEVDTGAKLAGEKNL